MDAGIVNIDKHTTLNEILMIRIELISLSTARSWEDIQLYYHTLKLVTQRKVNQRI